MHSEFFLNNDNNDNKICGITHAINGGFPANHSDFASHVTSHRSLLVLIFTCIFTSAEYIFTSDECTFTSVEFLPELKKTEKKTLVRNRVLYVQYFWT